MTISQIYANYQTPQNLQQHMLQVASLASIILDGWQGAAIHKDDIVTCALLHDVAKPITFDPNKQKQFVTTEAELEKIIHHIKSMQQKYGYDEHPAARAIFQELACNENVVRLIDKLEWINISRLLEENDLESLVLIYADMRIAPSGIVSLQERLQELQTRAPFPGLDTVMSYSDQLEKQISVNTATQLSAIDTQEIARICAKLSIQTVQAVDHV